MHFFEGVQLNGKMCGSLRAFAKQMLVGYGIFVMEFCAGLKIYS